MNLWSMKPDGTDLKQHTQHAGWDAMSASLYDGHIVYQLGADIHLFDLASGEDRVAADHARIGLRPGRASTSSPSRSTT